MNTQKLLALVHAYEALGMSNDAAFAHSFNEYMKIKNAQKESEQSVSGLAAAAGVACCEGVEA